MQLPGLNAYAAAKAGLEAFAEALRKEERERQVIVVRPGAVNTSFWRKVPFKMPGSALLPKAVAEKVVEAVNADCRPSHAPNERCAPTWPSVTRNAQEPRQ